MSKKRKKIRKVKLGSLESNTKKYSYKDIFWCVAIILVFIMIISGAISLFQGKVKKLNEENTQTLTPTSYLPTLDRMQNAKNIDITINKNNIDPGKITLDKDTDYNFRFIKSPDSMCQALHNEQLDYSLELSNTATSYPIHIPTAGEYSLNCTGDSLKILVQVK